MASPVLAPDEIFAANEKVRWVALATGEGEIIEAQMRPGLVSRSPLKDDEDFLKLGPLALLGIAGRHTKYTGSLGYVAVWYELVVDVYTWVRDQILWVGLERDEDAVSQFLVWLENRKRSLATK